jgi:uncharacterized membrane protein YkoI
MNGDMHSRRVRSLVLGVGATVVCLLFSVAVVGAFTMPKTRVSLEACMKAALARQPGDVVKVELKVEKGTPMYEFDIVGKDGRAWDIECDATSGKIVEVEREVRSAEDPAFKAKMKFSEAEARAVALSAYPGEVREVEFEIEEDGSATYEFDIVTRDGKEMKVEVDAASGKIVEVSEEIYQIGKE